MSHRGEKELNRIRDEAKTVAKQLKVAEQLIFAWQMSDRVLKNWLQKTVS